MKKGFTLIEMLTVIFLIGMLAALIVTSVGTSQKQARDTQRKSDIKQYQTALESYANLSANGLYPSRTGSGSSGVSVTANLCGDLNVLLEPDISCPEDPNLATQSYRYQSDGTGSGNDTATKYVLWAVLEGPSTTTNWVVCSNGASGTVTGTYSGLGGECPTLN